MDARWSVLILLQLPAKVYGNSSQTSLSYLRSSILQWLLSATRCLIPKSLWCLGIFVWFLRKHSYMYILYFSSKSMYFIIIVKCSIKSWIKNCTNNLVFFIPRSSGNDDHKYSRRMSLMMNKNDFPKKSLSFDTMENIDDHTHTYPSAVHDDSYEFIPPPTT